MALHPEPGALGFDMTADWGLTCNWAGTVCILACTVSKLTGFRHALMMQMLTAPGRPHRASSKLGLCPESKFDRLLSWPQPAFVGR